MIILIDRDGETFNVLNREDIFKDAQAIAKDYFAEFDDKTDYQIAAIDFDTNLHEMMVFEIERTEKITCTGY